MTDPDQFASIILKTYQTAVGLSPEGAGGTGTATAASGEATSSTQVSPAMPANTGTSTGVVRLRDVAKVTLGSQQYDQTCTLDGKPSVALSIYQLPGSNALDTASGVYAKMQELKSRFPDGLDYEIVYDTTPFIRESVDEVFHTLRDAVILVAIVVLAFLQNWKATIIPLIAVPVAIIGTFAVMAAFGFRSTIFRCSDWC